MLLHLNTLAAGQPSVSQLHGGVAIAICALSPELAPTWVRRPRQERSPSSVAPDAGWDRTLVECAELRDLATQVMRTGHAYQGRFVLGAREQRRALDLTLVPSTDAAGSVFGLTLCAVDVTPMAAAVDALGHEAETWRMLTAHSFDWEYWIGPDGALR